MNAKRTLLVLTVVLAVALIGCGPTVRPPVGPVGPTINPCPDNGTTFVNLAPQGSNTFVYANEQSNPLEWCSGSAVITGVTNTAGRAIALAHGGLGAASIALQTFERSILWNEMPVAGHWVAQLSGTVASLPIGGVTIQVDWRKQ